MAQYQFLQIYFLKIIYNIKYTNIYVWLGKFYGYIVYNIHKLIFQQTL